MSAAGKPRPRFSTRRRILLALVIVLLAVVGWMQYVGVAGLSGIKTADMDWNGDGNVTQNEILQSYYAVVVSKTQDGPRACSTYAWRSSGEQIRVDCRTSFESAPAKQEP